MRRYLLGLGTVFFLVCAMVNGNDPDWLIWSPFYLFISLSPFLWHPSSYRLLNLLTLVILVGGIAVYLKLLNPLMMTQADDQMVGLIEHQREGIGMVLGALWIKLSVTLKSGSAHHDSP